MKKIRNILVPVDFSKHSEIALDYALHIAKKAGATLTAMHATEILPLDTRGSRAIMMEYNNQVISEAKNKLDFLQKSIAETNQVEIETLIFEGNVGETIVLAAKQLHADLVVMGTLGESGIKERLFGSRTASVVGKLPVPMLVIPFISSFTNPKDIAVAIESTDQPGKQTEFIIQLATLFASTLHVCIFTESKNGNAQTEEEEKSSQKIEKYFESRYSPLQFHEFHLEGIRFVDSLRYYIAHHKIDVLSMVSHPGSFWKQIFHPDAAKKMTYEIDIPLVILPEEVHHGHREKKVFHF